MQMYEYRHVISNLNQHMIIHIPAVIIFLYLFIGFGNKFLMRPTRGMTIKEKGNLAIGVLALASVIVNIMINDGFVYFRAMSDYYFSTYEITNGEIVSTVSSRHLNDICIEVDNEKYYLDMKDEKELRNHIGDECSIVYGSQSKYIFEYKITDDTNTY